MTISTWQFHLALTALASAMWLAANSVRKVNEAWTECCVVELGEEDKLAGE